MLDIIPSCNLVQYQGKLITQSWENGKNHNFRANLGPLKFFSHVYVLYHNVPNYHPIQFPGKLIDQTWKNDKKPNLGSDWTNFEKMAKKTFNFGPNYGLFDLNLGIQKLFLQVLPLLVVRHCYKLSSYVIQRKTNKSNLTKWQKKLILGLILVRFFHGFFLYLMLYIFASYHSMQFHRKPMNQAWENSKKANFRPNFDPFGPNSGCQFFFFFFQKSVCH